MNDRARLVAGGGVRAVATGMMGISMGVYLATLGLSPDQIGAIVSAGVELGKDEQIQLTSLLVRTTRNRTQVYQGFLADDGSDIQVTALDFVQEKHFQPTFLHVHKLYND